MLFLVREGRSIFRDLVLTVAAGVVMLGAATDKRTLDGAHFEGFVFLVGLGLVLQGATELVVVLKTRHEQTASVKASQSQVAT